MAISADLKLKSPPAASSDLEGQIWGCHNTPRKILGTLDPFFVSKDFTWAGK